MKVVINDRHSGFGLSAEAMIMFKSFKGIDQKQDIHARGIDRCDAALVDVVETMGERANDRYSRLKIVEIPDGVDYFIQEYDGMEWIAESHRTWR